MLFISLAHIRKYRNFLPYAHDERTKNLVVVGKTSVYSEFFFINNSYLAHINTQWYLNPKKFNYIDYNPSTTWASGFRKIDAVEAFDYIQETDPKLFDFLIYHLDLIT